MLCAGQLSFDDLAALYSADRADPPQRTACAVCTRGEIWSGYLRRAMRCPVCHGSGVVQESEARPWWTTTVPLECRGCGLSIPRPSGPGPRPQYCEDCRPKRTGRVPHQRRQVRQPRERRPGPVSVAQSRPRPEPRRPIEESAQDYAYADHPEAVGIVPSAVVGAAFVYRCKDASGKVVYVGQTRIHPVNRLRSHKREHEHRVSGRHSGEPWYHLMVSVDWAELPTAAEAKAEEQRQIDIHNPIGNVLLRPAAFTWPLR